MDSQPPKPRLRGQFHAVMRAHHYSIRTEKVTGTGYAFTCGFTRCAIRWSSGLPRSTSL